MLRFLVNILQKSLSSYTKIGFVKSLIFILFLPITIWTHPIDNLTLDEKIGQLFIVPVCPLRDKDHLADVEKLIKEYHIGGVIVKTADPKTQIEFLNHLQAIAKYPLIVCIDAEWGLGMRMLNTISFPKNMTLGAIKNNELLYELGKLIGKQCRQAGAHINLAPVIDVNSNPLNPIIHMRSFGDNVDNVTTKASFLIKGMEEENNLFACCKHFPGHGDVSVDSHEELPIVISDLNLLRNVNLYPFINTKAHCVMTAHLLIPSLDLKNPATFSYKIVSDILQKEIGFNGLVITDALNMQALSRYYTTEDIALNAYIAGHDLLLYGDHIAPNVDKILKEDVPKAIIAMKKAFQEKKLDEKLLDKKVKKIFDAKTQLKLFDNRFTSTKNISFCTTEALKLKQQLFDEAITIVRDDEHLIKTGFTKKTACLKLGYDNEDIFDTTCTCFTEKNLALLMSSLSQFDKVIICLTTNIKKPPFSIPQTTLSIVEALKAKIPTIVVVFDTPYLLKDLKDFKSVIMAYENDDFAKSSAFKLLKGKILVKDSSLPIKVYNFPCPYNQP
jgi:beta-glucosidase-like glycosyl hydrolase